MSIEHTPFNIAVHDHLMALGYKAWIHEGTPQKALAQAARMQPKCRGREYDHRWDGPLPEWDEYSDGNGDSIIIHEDGTAVWCKAEWPSERYWPCKTCGMESPAGYISTEEREEV